MQIRVDLWAESGKWKYGGLVTISGNYHIWDDEFLEEIVRNQTLVVDSAFKSYVVTTRDLDETETDPLYTHFYHQMYRIGAFNNAVDRLAAE